MKTVYAIVCRVLIASIMLLPFSANAGMIGTTESIVSPSALRSSDGSRDALVRDNVAKELQAMGLSFEAAQERVAALTQDEVSRIAGEVEAAPAGGFGGALVLIALVAVAIYYLTRGAREER